MKRDYKIGEVAEMLNTTVRTIRYYEEEGLLRPPRTQGGTRRYGAGHILRLKAILHLAENQFPLEAIRVIASTREKCLSGDESSKAVTAQLDRAAHALGSRITELEHLRGELLTAKDLVAGCQGCNNRPTNIGCPDCPVRKLARNMELLSLIWDQETEADAEVI